MKRNREKSAAQGMEYQIFAQESTPSESTDDSPMLMAECQAEGQNLDINITLIHEFKPRT